MALSFCWIERLPHSSLKVVFLSNGHASVLSRRKSANHRSISQRSIFLEPSKTNGRVDVKLKFSKVPPSILRRDTLSIISTSDPVYGRIGNHGSVRWDSECWETRYGYFRVAFRVWQFYFTFACCKNLGMLLRWMPIRCLQNRCRWMWMRQHRKRPRLRRLPRLHWCVCLCVRVCVLCMRVCVCAVCVCFSACVCVCARLRMVSLMHTDSLY